MNQEDSPPYSRHRPLDPAYFLENETIELRSDIAAKLRDAQRSEIKEILAIFSNPNGECRKELQYVQKVAQRCTEMSLDMRRHMALMFIASRTRLKSALLPKGKDSSGKRLASVSQEIVQAFLRLVQNDRKGRITNQDSIAEDTQRREELHAFMLEEVSKQSTAHLPASTTGTMFTAISPIPTELPTKFYPILGLSASQKSVRVFCTQEGDTVHLSLLGDPSGKIVYSFSKTELSTPPPAKAR